MAVFNCSRYARWALPAATAFSVMPGLVSAQDTLEEVVVTAQKREENMQQVPVAVTALSSETLETDRFINVIDLNDAAPGLTVRESGGGGESPVFTMRGVYSAEVYASDPGVALYMDGIYIGTGEGAQFDLADVDRIEVLRGPQGTLFGRNAIAGAINVITKEPSGSFGAKQEVSYGNLDQRRYKTTINTPSMGPLSASIYYLHDQAGGDVRNLGAGTVWNFGPATDGQYGYLVSPSTLGGHDTDAIAATVKFDTDPIKAVYRFNNEHESYVPDASAPGSFGTSLGFIFEPFWAAQNPALRSPVGIERPDAVNNWYTTPGTLRVQSQSLILTAPITDSISVKSISGYRAMTVYSTNDLSGVGGILLAPGIPLLPIVNATQSDRRTWQEELQLNIDTKWVKSTLGYLHFRDKDIEGNFPNTYNAPFGSGLPGFTAAYTNFVAPTVDTVDDTLNTWSDALYSQDEVTITPQLSLVGGGRWTSDRKNGIDGASTPPATAVAPIDYHKSTWTYLAGINYKITDSIFAYLKNSTAYITGGEVSNIKFQPATADSWETGIKADLLDHTLRTNIALFTVEYGEYQIETGPRAGCPPSVYPTVSLAAPFCIINGGSAKDQGVEIEVTYVPYTGVTLDGSMAYNHMWFTTVNPGLRAPDGSYVAPESPLWTGELGANYRGPDLGALDSAHAVASIQVQYTSPEFPQTGDSIAFLNTVKIPAKTIINARAGFAGFKAGPVVFDVAGYVKNLTNNRSEAFGADLGADFGVTFQRAREYGIDMSASF
jgi:iron complex outermembrane receptor protein